MSRKDYLRCDKEEILQDVKAWVCCDKGFLCRDKEDIFLMHCLGYLATKNTFVWTKVDGPLKNISIFGPNSAHFPRHYINMHFYAF